MNFFKNTNKSLYILFCLILSLLITACSKAPNDYSSASNEQISGAERLGTMWGDEVTSHSRTVNAKRISDEPLVETQLRYAAKTFIGKSINTMSLNAGKISFSVIGDDGEPLLIFRDGKKYYLTAKEGQSYQLKYENHTNQAYEVVASVDGLDVLNGLSASKYNTGYLLYPKATLVIDGFRKSDKAVASFTFSKTKDAYSTNSNDGSEDNTGIIGMVIYEVKLPEEEVRVIETSTDSEYALAPEAFPADKN